MEWIVLVGVTGLVLAAAIGGWRLWSTTRRQQFAIADLSYRLTSSTAELDRQVAHDTLTGLPNRSTLERRLAALLDGTGDGAVGLVLLDLDGFKAINDGLGHPAGDEVLVAAGTRLRRSLRPTDLVGRIGGDEFGVVATDLTADGIAAIVERLVSAFREPIVVAGRPVALRASAGAALAGAGDTPADLFRHADVALYSAKASGKARLHVFEPRMLDEVQGRLATESELRVAVNTGQIDVFYQPTLCVRTGAVIGVEALARWHHPTRGLIEPASFITLAEDTGLIVPLGQVVLGAACRQVATWRDDPVLASLTLSVNVSAHQLRTAGILGEVRAALAASGLPADALVLEVTESATADAHAVATLVELKALGLRIALDDFGTGYSSLAYLQRLPIDVLKIDKSFLDDIDRHAERAVLANAIIRLARSFGLQTVAEGVERPEQLTLLARLGCDVGQGYLIGRPLPAAAARDALVALAIERPELAPAPLESTSRTVAFRVGPVDSASALLWLDYARDVIVRLRTSPPAGLDVPHGVLGAIDAYIDRWSQMALGSETFIFEAEEDVEILRAITHHWYAVAGALAAEAEANGHDEAPAEGEPFYEALVSALLVALAVDGDVEAEADAVAWDRAWPRAMEYLDAEPDRGDRVVGHDGGFSLREPVSAAR